MFEVEKACACVIRDGCLLVFRHPTTDVQLPKGTIELGEAPRDAVVRELFEESGLRIHAEPQLIATRVFERRPNGVMTDDPIERQTWHVFAVNGGADIASMWEHVAQGSPEEAGLRFSYFWHPLQIDFQSAFPDAEPVFADVVKDVQSFLVAR